MFVGHAVQSLGYLKPVPNKLVPKKLRSEQNCSLDTGGAGGLKRGGGGEAPPNFSIQAQPSRGGGPLADLVALLLREGTQLLEEVVPVREARLGGVGREAPPARGRGRGRGWGGRGQAGNDVRDHRLPPRAQGRAGPRQCQARDVRGRALLRREGRPHVHERPLCRDEGRDGVLRGVGPGVEEHRDEVLVQLRRGQRVVPPREHGDGPHGARGVRAQGVGGEGVQRALEHLPARGREVKSTLLTPMTPGLRPKQGRASPQGRGVGAG